MTKEQLSYYKSLKREITRQRERLLLLEMSLTSPKIPVYGDKGHPTGYVNDTLGDGVAKKIVLEKELKKNIERLEIEKSTIERAIQSIKNPIEREILRLRYLEGLNWEKISNATMYGERHCRRIHNNALANIASKTKKRNVS